MTDENEDIDVSNTSVPQIQPKKKKPFLMVKSGIDSKNITNKDEDAYVKNLLSDKNLIEEDIVLNRPNLVNLNTDLMSNSGSSVVITPTNNNESNSQNDLNYSDSDFESNLIDRLDNTADLSSSSSDYDSDQIVVLDPLNNSSDDDDIDAISSDDEDILPVNPATLDKKLFYAVHKFLGPESSHCPLRKNEECIVLNDEDVYWWLVRRKRDGRIGFVPGEILEGWNDKLARWNAFINERQSKEDKGEVDDSPINAESRSSLVKFDANVTYVPYNSKESVYSGSLHEDYAVDEDELKSDISWSSMPQLQIKKNGNTSSVKKQLKIAKIDHEQTDSPYWTPKKPFIDHESPSGSIGDYSTSESNSDSSVYEDSQLSSDHDRLHDDVSREYTPILDKIDDLVNLLS